MPKGWGDEADGERGILVPGSLVNLHSCVWGLHLPAPAETTPGVCLHKGPQFLRAPDVTVSDLTLVMLSHCAGPGKHHSAVKTSVPSLASLFPAHQQPCPLRATKQQLASSSLWLSELWNQGPVSVEVLLPHLD